MADGANDSKTRDELIANAKKIRDKLEYKLADRFMFNNGDGVTTKMENDTMNSLADTNGDGRATYVELKNLETAVDIADQLGYGKDIGMATKKLSEADIKNVRKHADMDGDHKVSAEELNILKETIGVADHNKDGKVTDQEIKDTKKMADTNKDGKVTMEEIDAISKKLQSNGVGSTQEASQASAPQTRGQTQQQQTQIG